MAKQNFFIIVIFIVSSEKESQKGERVSVRLIIFPARALHVDRKFYEEISRWREEKP